MRIGSKQEPQPRLRRRGGLSGSGGSAIVRVMLAPRQLPRRWCRTSLARPAAIGSPRSMFVGSRWVSCEDWPSADRGTVRPPAIPNYVRLSVSDLALREACGRAGSCAKEVIDFERAMGDPDRPDRLLPAYDSGDQLHPNDAGYRAMAAADDLRLFALTQTSSPTTSDRPFRILDPRVDGCCRAGTCACRERSWKPGQMVRWQTLFREPMGHHASRQHHVDVRGTPQPSRGSRRPLRCRTIGRALSCGRRTIACTRGRHSASRARAPRSRPATRSV